MLYLVSTPIGNLGDLSYRAVDTLNNCDYILCEDTRHSSGLLSHYAIKTSLRSFHKFNEAQTEERIIEDLRSGKQIALISDGGTPLISDPGSELVSRCRKENIPVSAIPGACALISALILSALPLHPFQFLGFLPKKEKERQAALSKILIYQGTSICYESPHRIEKTLHSFASLASKRRLCIARELTKIHEECLSGTALELISHFEKHPPRGEMILLVSPPEKENAFDHLSLEELVEMFQKDLMLNKSEAIKMASQMRNLPKREVYKQFINEKT